MKTHELSAMLRIGETLRDKQRPALMCSFGKDSLVLLDMLARFGVRDVLYLENIDEVVDHDYIAELISRYDLTLHPLPKGRGLLFFVQGTAQFFCFPYVSPTTMIPVPMALTAWDGTSPAPMCVDDELRADLGTTVPYTFDLLFWGQKRADLLDGGGACLPWFPMLAPDAQHAYHARMTPQSPLWSINDIACCSPLWDWSQDAVWDYIDARGLPLSAKVYDGRQRRLHRNNACFRCHDPSLPMTVYCPKSQAFVTNMGAITAPDGLSQLQRLGLLTADEARDLHADRRS